jgi:hypothetical protein
MNPLLQRAIDEITAARDALYATGDAVTLAKIEGFSKSIAILTRIGEQDAVSPTTQTERD